MSCSLSFISFRISASALGNMLAERRRIREECRGSPTADGGAQEKRPVREPGKDWLRRKRVVGVQRLITSHQLPSSANSSPAVSPSVSTATSCPVAPLTTVLPPCLLLSLQPSVHPVRSFVGKWGLDHANPVQKLSVAPCHVQTSAPLPSLAHWAFGHLLPSDLSPSPPSQKR